MKKAYVKRTYEKLSEAMDELGNGDINYSQLGEYVYDVVGDDILTILADWLNGEELE